MVMCVCVWRGGHGGEQEQEAASEPSNQPSKDGGGGRERGCLSNPTTNPHTLVYTCTYVTSALSPSRPYLHMYVKCVNAKGTHAPVCGSKAPNVPLATASFRRRAPCFFWVGFVVMFRVYVCVGRWMVMVVGGLGSMAGCRGKGGRWHLLIPTLPTDHTTLLHRQPRATARPVRRSVDRDSTNSNRSAIHNTIDRSIDCCSHPNTRTHHALADEGPLPPPIHKVGLQCLRPEPQQPPARHSSSFFLLPAPLLCLFGGLVCLCRGGGSRCACLSVCVRWMGRLRSVDSSQWRAAAVA